MTTTPPSVLATRLADNQPDSLSLSQAREQLENLSPASRWSLIYDVMILGLIAFNLLLVVVDHSLMSSLAEHLSHGWPWLQSMIGGYHSRGHEVVQAIDQGITVFLIVELVGRWLLALVTRKYKSWFMFPLIHWYEVLAVIPQLRALRLLRAIVTGVRLERAGVTIVPPRVVKRARWLYHVLLEEVSDRIVLRILDGVEDELMSGQLQQKLLTRVMAQEREHITNTLRDWLGNNVPTLLAPHQAAIEEYVGQAVSDALHDTPEVQRILRLIPIAGPKIDQQLGAIGDRLGRNLTGSLTAPLMQPTSPIYQALGQSISRLDLSDPRLIKLADQITLTVLNTIREQVAVQQWKVRDQIARLPASDASLGASP